VLLPLNGAFLPYGRQNIDDADIDAVVSVLKSDWLTTGPAVEALEAAVALKVDAPYALCCANGSAALHLGYLALGLKQGDRVVVPAITFLATANAARLAGAEIIFADVDPDTGLMTPDTLRDALGRADGPVAAIAPVHMGGQMVDMDEVRAIADQAGARVILDACHALGGIDAAGRPIGGSALADLTVFSLHPVKVIACGEGGLITTADADLADAVRRYRNHGMIRDKFSNMAQAQAPDGTINPWYYEMLEPGLNYRLSDIHAALAMSQLKKLDQFVEQRRVLVEYYDDVFAALPAHVAAVMRPSGRVSHGAVAWHLYVALIDFGRFGRDRASVMHLLRERGIGSQVHYLPLHRQPYYLQRYGALDLPGADQWYARALSLPLHPGMELSDVDRVMAALSEITERSQ
jgi:UDP-4-amino-4,6-dideoxy-N-acetyl-beta-L-altrosamine transaminase